MTPWLRPISTRTPRAGSDDESGLVRPGLDEISTRTPRAGSDDDFVWLSQCSVTISTRTPRAGSDHPCRDPAVLRDRFQPALPVRGVTSPYVYAALATQFQPALPVRGVTSVEDGDKVTSFEFQPALPVREVTRSSSPVTCPTISTRTPRAGSDDTESIRWLEKFQPALPVREVTIGSSSGEVQLLFQPALPVRGVTELGQRRGSLLISTRTPRAGSDTAPLRQVSDDFNPHSPCGE